LGELVNKNLDEYMTEVGYDETTNQKKQSNMGQAY